MAKAYLSIGTNLGDKRGNLLTATALLKERVGDMLALSTIYETEPWGFESQHTFFNAALILETALSPMELLDVTCLIETEMGRINKSDGSYQDRIIDIDILLYDDLILQTDRLTLPHPLMHKRTFVMEPLAEIAPDVVHPLLHKPMIQLRSILSE